MVRSTASIALWMSKLSSSSVSFKQKCGIFVVKIHSMIAPLLIEESGDTPNVVFDPTRPKFELSGRSLPENAAEFYQPLFEWIVEYSKNPLKKTVMEINMFYFNTSSSKMILDLLYRMEDLQSAGHEVQIIWYCDDDDEDMVEMGEEFSELIEVPVEIIFNKE
jgi:hypothetical protein